MTLGPHHYVPVLKVKRGEKSALQLIDFGLRDHITPLLEIVESSCAVSHQAIAFAGNDDTDRRSARLLRLIFHPTEDGRQMLGKRALLTLVPIAASIAWIAGAQNTTLDSMLAEDGLDGLKSFGCYACKTCPKDPDGHHLEGSPDPLEIGRQHPDEEEFCHPSTCGGHFPCDPEMAMASPVPNLPAILQAIKDATPEDLTALAAKHPDRLRINHDRRALQLVGCGNRIIASYGTMSIPSLEMLLS